VISGYVITSSLHDRQNKGLRDFLVGFYKRRIKRLAPALSVFVAITSILICLFSPSPEISLRTGLSSLFGLSNIYLLRQSTDYFGEPAQLNVFTHTWSLGVEEQFYILFPFLIWFTRFRSQTKGSERNLFIAVTTLTVASLTGYIYVEQANPSAAYFLMLTRLWEMATGCLIFLGVQKRASIVQKLEKAPPLLATGLMVAAMYLPASVAAALTVTIVGLTSVLLVSLKEKTTAYRILTNSKVVYIGLISYSLYLRHWSVLSISRWTVGIHWWTVPFQMVLTFNLAVGSYEWIEKPLRYGDERRRRWINLTVGVMSILIAALALVFLDRYRLLSAVSRNLGIIRIKGKTITLNQRIPGTSINRENCHEASIGNYQKFSKVIQYCNHDFANMPYGKDFSIFLAGDSHSYMLRPALSNVSKETGAHLFSLSGGRFPPDRTRFENGKAAGNPRLMKDYMAYISSRAKKGTSSLSAIDFRGCFRWDIALIMRNSWIYI